MCRAQRQLRVVLSDMLNLNPLPGLPEIIQLGPEIYRTVLAQLHDAVQ